MKSSIGHLEAAAGLAGLLKAALAVKHGQIPVQSHYHQPNPHIPWAELPFAIPRQTLPWPAGYAQRIAGISAFGMSGTNAHVVLEAPPAAVAEDIPNTMDRPRHLLALSARQRNRPGGPWPAATA
ncbi:ketoacyl-synthetase C-terminal extension domain-containing protein, partial [Methylogaea oryzae]|uniref:ketoacyl-synthetase C-terminal extension domain-containing protein n=1 Tax=Methylogaea oryzae TaxID=1295382 RepID=UPI001C3F4C48